MFDRILVPIDGGPGGAKALVVGEILADLWNASLEVLTLLTLGDDLSRREQVVDAQIAAIHHRVRTVVRPVVYSVADEIADEFEAEPNTLVVMSSSARPRAAAVLGSVAESVLNFIDGPVVLVGPNAKIAADWPSGPLYLCTDGSGFAEAIIPSATLMAKGLDMHPWVITVLTPSDAAMNPGLETGHLSQVAKSLRADIGAVVDYEVLHDVHPAEAIVDYAKQNKAGLIALSTHGRTGFPRLALGSVAMAVVHDAPCPVLVSQPRASEISADAKDLRDYSRSTKEMH